MSYCTRKQVGAAAALLLWCVALSFGGVAAEKVGSTVVDPGALTIDAVNGQAINGQSFQQDAMTSFDGWQYAAYYDAARRVCLARRSLPAGAWQVLRLDDYRMEGNDALM